MFPYLLIALGFVALIKGADFLVDGAASIARRFRISDLVIGLTIVAFGTSSPELFVNIIASSKGSAGIAVGNIVGSTIANVLLVLGAASIIYPLSVTKGTVRREIPLGMLATVLLAIFANDVLLFGKDVDVLSRFEAGILLLFFVFFLSYSFRITTRAEDLSDEVPSKQFALPVAISLVVLGLCGLSFGGQWIVSGATTLAKQFNVSDSLIGLTIIAIGTCLPELATAIVAAVKKNPDIAIGGIVGSNIFNIFFVLGVTAMIRPLPMPVGTNIDMAVMIGANIFLFVAMFTGGKRVIDRWEGGVFLLSYFGYIAYLILQR